MAKMTKIKMICPDCGKVDEIEEEQTISYLTGRTPEVEGEHRKTLMGRFLDIDSKIYHNRRIEARVCDIISVKDDEPCYSCFLMNESSFRHMMENVKGDTNGNGKSAYIRCENKGIGLCKRGVAG